MATYNNAMEPSMVYIAAEHEPKPEGSRSRRRKPSKGASSQKKKPQRGMGVAQLERLRQQEWNMMTGMSPMSPRDHSLHFQPHYALALPEPIPSFPVLHRPAGACCAGGSGLYSPDLRVVQVGSSMGNLVETSKELSSMPKMQQQWPIQVPHERCEVCLKKKRFNGENMGLNGGKDMYAEISPINHSEILGFNQENNVKVNMNYFNGGINDFGARAARSAFYAAQSLEEGHVEVRAVHRNGNTAAGRSVFMEYEFFPGKGGRSSSSKELEFPVAEVSVPIGGEASCFTSNAASNSVDLSLKLSY